MYTRVRSSPSWPACPASAAVGCPPASCSPYRQHRRPPRIGTPQPREEDRPLLRAEPPPWCCHSATGPTPPSSRSLPAPTPASSSWRKPPIRLNQRQGDLMSTPVQPAAALRCGSFGELGVSVSIEMSTQHRRMGRLGRVEPEDPIAVMQLDDARAPPASPPFSEGTSPRR